MSSSKLDKIDKKILRNLQSDGRMTNVDLAKDVGISAPPCLRRVRALEEHGYIKGYHAKVDASSLGYNVTVFAMVKLTSHAEKELKKFEQEMNGLEMVRECHMIAGETDFMLKVVARDWDHYQTFLTETLTSIDNVTSVKSSLCIRPTKHTPGVPIQVD